MKVLIAPDKFKGSLSAVAAAGAISRGVLAAWPGAQVQTAPIADGGEGFAETMCEALRGEWVELPAQDPLGREVPARYAWVESTKLAVLEMSEASGIWRLSRAELSPMHAHTFGTGQLMRHAIERGAQTLLVGLGGSATTDGGVGMANALGFEFLDANGTRLDPGPCNLHTLAAIRPRTGPALPQILAACDVQNPLLGERGTARVFGPQKGAGAPEVAALEKGMENLARVVHRDLGCDFRDAPGAGAAGGIGFGLMSFCGAKIRSGFGVGAEALRLDAMVREADLVITGEGRIDGQTLEGKGPAGVAQLARAAGKPVLALAGAVSEDPALHQVFDALAPIVDRPLTLEEAMGRGAELLERAAQRAVRFLQIGTHL